MYLNITEVDDVFTKKQQNAVTTVIANEVNNLYSPLQPAINGVAIKAMTGTTIVGGVDIKWLESRVTKIEADMHLMDLNMRMHQTELEELTKAIKLIKESSILGKVVRLEPDKEEE